MSSPPLFVVDGCIPAPDSAPDSALENLRDSVFAFALDQRAFGPRKLWVAFADVDGRFRGLTYTDRTDPLLPALEACLMHLGAEAAAAVVFCDEPVSEGPPTEAFLAQFQAAQELAAEFGIHLVDWFSCDDDLFRAARLRSFHVADQPDWWDVPAERPIPRMRPRSLGLIRLA